MKAIAEVYTECQLDKAERFLKKLVTGLAPRSETAKTQGFTESVKLKTEQQCLYFWLSLWIRLLLWNFPGLLYLTTCRKVQEEKKKFRSTIHRTRVLHECVLVISLLLLLLSLLCRGCQVKAYTHWVASCFLSTWMENKRKWRSDYA